MATPSEGNDRHLHLAGGGSPVVYGPVGSCDVNPFWSQSTKEEVILGATRPSSLPERGGPDQPTLRGSGLGRLRKEIMEIKGVAGGACGFGGQQPGQLLALPGPSLLEVVVKHTSMGLLLCLLKERLSMEGTNRELMEG